MTSYKKNKKITIIFSKENKKLNILYHICVCNINVDSPKSRFVAIL